MKERTGMIEVIQRENEIESGEEDRRKIGRETKKHGILVKEDVKRKVLTRERNQLCITNGYICLIYNIVF